jgi:hypothetical protein
LNERKKGGKSDFLILSSFFLVNLLISMALDLGFFQIARRSLVRQFLFVIGTLDLALVLLFTIMADWNDFDSLKDWWLNMVCEKKRRKKGKKEISFDNLNAELPWNLAI